MYKIQSLVFFITTFRISLGNNPNTGESDHSVEHMTMYDTFFGDESMNQVCYPKDHQKFYYLIFGLLILAVILAGVVLYFRSKYTKKVKEDAGVLKSRNTELEESLRYAQGIQRTILPTESEFKSLFPNSFLYSVPKDIVSGDFYYCTEVDKMKFLAVIDCTGHGVPGAFLTLIGNQAIKRAIHDDGILQPNEILSQMNRYVKTTLKQMDSGSIQDGMVVSLIKIDEENERLEFSGAGMDMVYIKGGEVERVRGNRLTVGTDEKHVTEGPKNHVFDLASMDRIFLYSDGVVDQFGVNDEKFKTKRLLDFFQTTLLRDIDQTSELFRDNFEGWRGKNEFVDDVTLIGLDLKSK